MKKLLTIFLFLCLTASAFGQFFAPHQKPMLGLQVNHAHPLAPNAGFWPLNEGSGNIIQDLSGNGNIGTLTGDTFWTAGNTGSALYFPGTTDDVDITSTKLAMGAGDWSAVARFRFEAAVPAFEGLVVFDNDGIVFEGANIGIMQDGDLVLSTPLSLNTWYTIVVTRSGTNYKVYLNGIDSSGGPTEAGYGLAGVYSIGRGYTNDYFEGSLDFVSIYNRALTAQESALLYSELYCFMKPSWNWALYGGISVVAPSGQVIFINN